MKPANKKRLEVALASAPHITEMAYRNISKASIDKYYGSAVMLTIKNINVTASDQIVEEVVISNGLSNETIECIKKDLLRSFEHNMELPLAGMGYESLKKKEKKNETGQTSKGTNT